MTVDLTNTFNDARKHLNLWKTRYTQNEYPIKVVLNIFYRKYSTEKLLAKAINQSLPTWEIAYEKNTISYSEIANNEIAPILENIMATDRPVCNIKPSDFENHIKLAMNGDINAIKGIEFTYFLNRFFDELAILWLSMLNSGETQTGAITKLTGAILPNDFKIKSYSDIENAFDQLGTENYLQTLLIKELNS
jgi:hypothetical protein